MNATHIKVMVTIYIHGWPIDRLENSQTEDKCIGDLLHYRLIIGAGREYTNTAKGTTWVEALISMPLPIKVTVTPDPFDEWVKEEGDM